MASNYPISTVPDNMNDLLYIKRSVGGEDNYCGYRREYLGQNLTELEREMLLCKVCEGMMRNASFVKEETTCLYCSETPNQLNAVKLVENSVNKLEIKCPLLRNCEWKGKLSEAETHLEKCQHFLIECRACKQAVKRGSMGAHKWNICPLQKVICEYCNKSGKVKDYTEHLECCKKYSIKCPNECGKTIPYRELSDHNATDCPLAEIACPYAKYGCKANKMKRRDLLAHKKEYITEHMDMIETENRNLRVVINKLKSEIHRMKRLDGLRWEIQNVDEKIGLTVISPVFYVNKYKLECFCNVTMFGFNFTIQRIEGEHDQNLGIAFITEYRVITEKKDGTHSYDNGFVNYELKIGTVSPEFYFCCSQKNVPNHSLTILFCFDVDSCYSQLQKPAEQIIIQSNINDPFMFEFDYPID